MPHLPLHRRLHFAWLLVLAALSIFVPFLFIALILAGAFYFAAQHHYLNTLLLLFSAMAFFFVYLRALRKFRRDIRTGIQSELRRRNFCPQCEYNLRASHLRCPECGHSIQSIEQ